VHDSTCGCVERARCSVQPNKANCNSAGGLCHAETCACSSPRAGAGQIVIPCQAFMCSMLHDSDRDRPSWHAFRRLCMWGLFGGIESPKRPCSDSCLQRYTRRRGSEAEGHLWIDLPLFLLFMRKYTPRRDRDTKHGCRHDSCVDVSTPGPWEGPRGVLKDY
jgi:hypothetical protein